MKPRQSKIDLQNSSKKQKSNSLDSVDRISGLPDSILGIILSSLPTKDAVATCVLSKSWKFMWRTVHNFDFSHWGYRVKRCISFLVRSWINTAITRNVHELALCVEARVGPESSPKPIGMPALSFATISLSTEFKRLEKLKTGSYCCYCSSLLEFIQSSERLEVLTINKHSNRFGKELHDRSKWTAPAEVPRCLSNSLKKVELDGYCGYEDEHEMIRYILKHGTVLEVVKISIDSLRENVKLELAQEICKFPRKSSACEIVFFGDLLGQMPLVRSSDFHSVSCSAKSASVTLIGP